MLEYVFNTRWYHVEVRRISTVRYNSVIARNSVLTGYSGVNTEFSTVRVIW